MSSTEQGRRTRRTLGTWLALVATLWLPGDSARAEQAELVDYFAGKDETCLYYEPREIVGRMQRLLFVIDYYGAGDTELWCTLVVVPGVADESRVLRFSASSRPCRRLLLEEPRRAVRLHVVKDHMCDLEFVDDPAE